MIPYMLMVCFLLMAHVRHSNAQKDIERGRMTFYNFYNTPVSSDTVSKIQTALKAAELTGSNTDILFYKICLAYAAWFNCQGHNDQFIEWCQKELDRSEPGEAEFLDVYLALAEYYLYTEHPFILSEKCLDQASLILSKYYNENDYHYGIFNILKGYIHMRKYDGKSALHYFRQSLEQIKDIAYLDKYRYLNHLGIIHSLYDFSYDPSEIIRYSNETILWCEKINQPTAPFHYFNGLSYIAQGDTAKAIICMQKAADTKAHEITAITNYYVSHALYNLFWLSGLKRTDYRTKALYLSERVSHNERSRLYLYMAIGKSCYNKKNYQESLRLLQKAVIAGAYNFKDSSVFSNPPLTDIRPYYNVADVYTFKARVLAFQNPGDKNNQDAALESVDLATRIIERFAQDVNEENSGLALTEDLKKSLNNLVVYSMWKYNITGDSSLKTKAFAASERSKSLVLRVKTSLRSKMVNGGVADSLIMKYENLNNWIIEEEIKNKDFKTNSCFYNEKLISLYNERDRVELQINEKFPDYQSTKYVNPLAEVKDVQKYLNDDQAVVEYQLTDMQLIMFIITKTQFIVKVIKNDGRCTNEIQKLRNSLSQPPVGNKLNSYDDFISSSSYLYDFLIKPVADTVSCSRLIIVPNAQLTTIPFEVLISEKPRRGSLHDYRNLSYLVKTFAVSYAYSCTFLLEQEPDNSSEKKNMGIFIPEYEKAHSAFTSLEGAKNEGLYIKGLSSGHLFKGKHAGEDDFKEKASHYKILHIASHAVMSEKDPTRSCLVMSKNSKNEDGLLHAYEIRQMKLNARLVVLSGCNTGNGKLQLNEGLVSLARYFFYTGVRTVAVTLWPVSDQTAAWLISRFYIGIKNNESLDMALKEAKLEYISHADPVNAHPYYWSNYIIVGKTQPIILEVQKSQGRFITIALAILVVVVSFILILRKKLIR